MADALRYAVDLRHRRQHLVTVRLTLPADLAGPVTLAMPTWTPGSYVMRDYVHHLQSLEAADPAGDPLDVQPDGHTRWTLQVPAGGATVTWELYANDLTVRTNHVDDHHALLVGPATFVVVEAARDRRHEVTVHADAPVWSLLPPGQDDGVFVADDLDHLLDAAFEVGEHPHVEVDVAGVPHRFAWAGHGGAPDLDRIGQDVTDVAQAAVALFEGDLPVDAYTFLCVGWDEGGGGLEHRDGSVLMMPVTTFQDEDAYARFQTLLAHEYLHLWNVKRLVPADLVRPDPVAHTHTGLLWVAEGWTAYYDELLPLRAGRWTTARYLTAMGEQLDKVLERPGTALQSVEEASHHAWTKLYVRDENSDNAGTNYYDHGAVLAWCLDLLIRRERPDGDGLDEAFRSLWRQFGGHRSRLHRRRRPRRGVRGGRHRPRGVLRRPRGGVRAAGPRRAGGHRRARGRTPRSRAARALPRCHHGRRRPGRGAHHRATGRAGLAGRRHRGRPARGGRRPGRAPRPAAHGPAVPQRGRRGRAARDPWAPQPPPARDARRAVPSPTPAAGGRPDRTAAGHLPPLDRTRPAGA